jgi:hypothetical protein
MALLKMKSTLFAIVVATLLVNHAESFSPFMQTKSKISRTDNRVLFLAAGADKDGSLDGAQITSARTNYDLMIRLDGSLKLI